MTETEERLAQLTQELLPLCSIAAKPTIMKIEMLVLFQEQRIKTFIKWLETKYKENQDDPESTFNEYVIYKMIMMRAKEML